jgi:dihydrofolate reductase
MDAIVAVYKDWGIGANGTQPIVIPEDRKHFQELTEGAAVIVGRRTFEDFPGGRPLKNRVNIVLSRRDTEIEGATVAHSVEEALNLAKKYPRVFVIGGESIYNEFLSYCEKIYITKIAAKPESDAFFPNLDFSMDWCCERMGPEMEYEGIKYRFCLFESYNMNSDMKKTT